MNLGVRIAIGMAFSLLVAGCVTLAVAEESTPRRLGLVINEDNSHFFGSRKAEDMTVEGLHAFVDQYAGTSVSHLFLCPNAMRASFRSTTRDAIWDAGTQTMPTGDDHGGKWVRNARLLFERDLDPYAIWITRCREQGISPWLSMRMNDVHDATDDASFMHSSFWVQHPEFRRVPGSSGSWGDRALDYTHPEVREHAMSFIRELLERYDPDGLELDWMRFGYHIAPGKEAEGAEILTQFMRDVRALTRKWSQRRGHPILLGARVPTDPDAARGLGMDGVRWGREGLLDMLVPAPFWTTSDCDIPVELWRERLGDAAGRIILAPALEFNLRAFPGGGAVANDLESTRGFAAAAWHRGADQIYLFNFMDSETIPVPDSDYRQLIEQGLGEDVTTRLPRRHVSTFRDTVPPGFPSGTQLPIEARSGGEIRLHIGPAPESGAATFVLGLAARDGVEMATLEVTVNVQRCTAAPDHAQPDRFPGVKRAVCFTCPEGALRSGNNVFVIRQTGQEPDQQVVWAEVRMDPRE